MISPSHTDGVTPAAAMPNFMALHGEKLLDGGYPILPIVPGAKYPGLWSQSQGWRGHRDWPKHGVRGTKPFEYALWRNYPGCGVGIATGRVVAGDIDIRDAEI